MPATIFDSLTYFERMKNAGFTEEQAKVQASTLQEISENRLATKSDIAQLAQKISLSEQRVTSEMQKLELRMTLKLGGMVVAAVAIVATMVKLL